MAENQETPDRPDLAPDLARGIAEAELADGGMLVGHVDGKPVLLVRRGEEIFAIGAECTHYNGPLAEGLVVGETIRCPWHHARFDLRTGEAVAAPALAPVGCWSVERRDGRIVVGKKKPAVKRELPGGSAPQRIVIVGGGAAGFAAAQRLRNLGYAGGLVMLSDDADLPVDRPNLSKDFLAGKAPQDWMPLRGAGFFEKQNIDLRLATKVAAIDVAPGKVRLGDGTMLAYDRLLLATGAEPVRLSLPGADLPHVHTLRTFADCRAIIAQARTARRAVVMGASFIGLEVAAALRERGLEVHVVAPDKRPMERILGPQIGDFIRALHERHGVVFHLEDTASAITDDEVRLAGGGTPGVLGIDPAIEALHQFVVGDRGLRDFDAEAADDDALHMSCPPVCQGHPWPSYGHARAPRQQCARALYADLAFCATVSCLNTVSGTSTGGCAPA